MKAYSSGYGWEISCRWWFVVLLVGVFSACNSPDFQQTSSSPLSTVGAQQATITQSVTFTAPASITAEAAGSHTLIKNIGQPKATGFDSSLVISNNAPSNGFLIRKTTVRWLARDSTGRRKIALQYVTIEDTQPPVFIATTLLPISYSTTGNTITLATLSPPMVTDLFPTTLTSDTPNNPVFPLGVHTITWTATDTNGNSTSKTQLLTVSESAITSPLVPSPTPSPMPLTTLDSGENHNCTIKQNGSLWCWGDNDVGQLGDGTTNNNSQAKQIGVDTNWSQIHLGNFHSCALKTDNSLWCWGSNSNGQLGDNTTTNSPRPTLISTGWLTLSLGRFHSCGIKTDGRLWCWGNNAFGQLGDRSTIDKDNPIVVNTDTDWAKIALGADHSCAIKIVGSLWCWGSNLSGQLGNNTQTDTFQPMSIGADQDWAIVAANGSHTCAIKTNGSLWCWGENYFAQLGLGNDSFVPKSIPTQVGTDSDWTQIQLTIEHSCGLKNKRTLWCWGKNYFGQLGNDATDNETAPIIIGTDNDWVQLSLGESHSCAMKLDNSLWCWGANHLGQLGLTDNDVQLSPIRIF